MAELELKKQWIDVEASEKQMQVEDYRLTAQHQREREKELHDMQMLHLRLQYQGGTAAGMGQFGMTQFPNQGAFRGVGTVGGDNFGVPTFNGAVPANDFGPGIPHFNG